MDIFKKLGRSVEKAKREAGIDGDGEGSADGEGAEFRCADCEESYSAPREECLECGGDIVVASTE